MALWVSGCMWPVRVHAVDPAEPTIRSYAGAFLAGDGDHDFFVEEEVRLPLLQLEPVGVYYRYRESTPFVRESDGPQAEVLYTRYDLQTDLKLTDQLRLIALGGHQAAYNVDESGLISAYVIGGGLGSPLRRDGRLYWHALAGGYVDRRDLDSNWWTDLSVAWRAIDFASRTYMGSDFRPSILLVGDVESTNNGGEFGALYRIGPDIQLQTAFGNRANVQFRWYYNDNNPFYGSNENGFLVGLDITGSFDSDAVLDARSTRPSGWLPLIWGEYDIGIGSSLTVSYFDMNVELVDFPIAGHRFTGVIGYQTRQEQRNGDFDNVAYSVSIGLQTGVGLESVLSHGDPLVLGVDFLHRSDHALNPDPNRVPPPEMVANGHHNVLPRLRLQTLGWDLPYRDPSMYEARTDWLNLFDWRLTAGYNIEDDRDRGEFAAQVGLNWDVATLQGHVMYLLGIVSLNNETPDWLGEFGLRRPVGKLFARYESYGMKSAIASGDTFVIGVGINL